MPAEKPVLFLWGFSPWASKVVSYLALRHIPHSRCEQPITQPRPDLAALGINYRRIPVVAIGRDFYCDTLLILEKLEKLYPAGADYPNLSATNPTDKALERLLEKWTDVVVFKPAAAAIPTDLDLMKDPTFQKDREELWGRPWTKEAQEQLRPAALVNMRAFFDFLENLFKDGRKWALGGEEPKLADIHAAWIFNWLGQLPGAFDANFFNKDVYPSTLAWLDRYHAAVEKAKEDGPTPPELEGADAVKQILASGFSETDLVVEPDPLGLKAGDEIEMYPVDTGYDRKDKGQLVALNANEAVVKTRSMQDGKEVRIHYPRWNFEINKIAA